MAVGADRKSQQLIHSSTIRHQTRVDPHLDPAAAHRVGLADEFGNDSLDGKRKYNCLKNAEKEQRGAGG